MYPSKLVLELREIGEMTILQFVEWKSVCEHFSYFFLTMSCIFQLVFGLKFLAVFTQFGTKFRCFHSQLVPVSKSETGKFFFYVLAALNFVPVGEKKIMVTPDLNFDFLFSYSIETLLIIYLLLPVIFQHSTMVRSCFHHAFINKEIK